MHRLGEFGELVVDGVKHVALVGDLEQRPRVDPGDLLHLV
jgi:hypothetical protein